ncbi:caM kinase-like vesicle-associated protein [Cetorhinus maximus]
MYILLSGNPPFYDESEDEENESHNRAIFRKILAGEFEFEAPYWVDISGAAKDLVCRLLEVDQEQRVTASEALAHTWISGNAALEKDLKLGVCAQMEKNFAKAKWKKAIRATTLMHRLRSTEQRTLQCSGSSPQPVEKILGSRDGTSSVGETPLPHTLTEDSTDHPENRDSSQTHGLTLQSSKE